MRSSLFALALLALVAVTLTGCEVVGDIFQAGIWVGILAVVGIIALVLWLFGRRRK